MGSAELLLGIDVGTTNCKAGLFTGRGAQVTSCSEATPTVSPRAGWYEHPPAELWEVVVRLIRRVLEGSEPGAVKAVVATGMAEAGVPLDGNGRAVYPAISWGDERTEPQARRFGARVGDDELFSVTGLQPSHIYTLHKLSWLSEHLERGWASFKWWVDLPGYVAYRLCGEVAMDYSQASRTMALDIWNRRLHRAFCEASDVSPTVFPPLAQAGTRLGEVTEEASRATGLPVNAVVGLGGHDHLCAALSAGVLHRDTWLNSVGTTDVLLTSADRDAMRAVANTCRQGLIGCHAVADLYYLLLALPAAGRLVDWIVDLGGGGHEEALAAAARVERGSGGLTVFPRSMEEGAHWLGGLSESQGRGHLLRGAVEGLCFETRREFDKVPASLRSEAGEVRAVGGGTQNELWMRTKAAVLGRTIAVPAVREAGCFGAALLAGTACGVFPSAHQAWQETYHVARTVVPDPEEVQAYATLYRERYLPLRTQLLAAQRAVAEGRERA